MDLKPAKFVEHTLGHCPCCGHLINVVGYVGGNVGTDVTNPRDIPKGDSGCIHCGECLTLLVFGPGIPLHVASKEEEEEVIKIMGKETFEELVRQVKDKRAFKIGLA